MGIGDAQKATEVVGVAEQVDGEDGLRARPDRGVGEVEVHVEGVDVDVDETQLEAVLLKRVVGGRPGDRGHENLVARVQIDLGVEHRGRDRDEIRAATRVHHDGVA